MASFNGGTGGYESPAARKRREKAQQREQLSKIEALGDDAKTSLAARAIASAVEQRGAVTERDLTQAGLTVDEAKRLYEPAMTRARADDPALFASA